MRTLTVFSGALLVLVMVVFAVTAMAGPRGERVETVEFAVADGIECVPGEFLVRFTTDAPPDAIDAVNRAHGARVKYTSPITGTTVIEVPAGKTISNMVSLYRSISIVKYAEPNGIVRAHAWTPNDPYYTSHQWHMWQIDMPDAWEIEKGDSTVILSILDTGIAYEDFNIPSYELETVQSGVTQYKQAPDLAGTKFVAGYDFVNDDAHPNDNNGHGTHVAGTAAQTTNNNHGAAGVAFQCALMPVKVLDYWGFGDWLDLAEGITWAADNGAHVINMSLGGYSYSQDVFDAVKHADSLGVVMVASSGNSYNGVHFPATMDEVIAVGATDVNDVRADYSNYGSQLELVAPGGTSDEPVWQETFTQETVVKCNPRYCWIQKKCDPTQFSVRGGPFYGTSMAAPHVSGLVGLLISNGYTGSDFIRQILRETAVDLGASGWDQYYGYGRIDADSALGYSDSVYAEFMGDPTSGYAPLTVQFTDQSSGPVSTWDWDFGDGGTSGEQNPFYTYDSASDYTVSLTVAGPSNSDTETKVNYIHVEPTPPPPVAEFYGVPDSGDVPLTVNFYDQSTGIIDTWDWDFGDGGTSEDQNPTYTYTGSGYYTVSLTVTGPGGSDTETKVDYIHVTGEANKMHISSIDPSTETTWTGKNSWTRGVATVTVVDVANAPVSGATVYGTWRDLNSVSGDTDANGEVTLSSDKVKNACQWFVFCVDNVEKAGWTYDSGANVETCDSAYYCGGSSKPSSFEPPETFQLFQNYPNPFNPETEIRYALPRDCQVTLTVYNLQGQKVATLVEGWQSAGYRSVRWDASTMASGIYVYRLQAGDLVETMRMVLLR